MIQQALNGMVTLMLAKFMLNDVPHAAGLFTNLQLQYGSKVKPWMLEWISPGQYACDPANMPSFSLLMNHYLNRQDWEYDYRYSLRTVPSVVRLLRDYVEMASSVKPTDPCIGSLFYRTQKAAMVAGSRLWRIIKEEEKLAKPEEVEWRRVILKRLQDIYMPGGIAVPATVSRLDKITYIEKYMNLHHTNGLILDYSFGEIGGDMEPDYVLFPYLDEVAREVLDCLAK